jgi:F-type H+-transporting ATPase subunit b
MSQLREDMIQKPPPLPILVEESEVKDVSDYDPKRESLEEYLNIRFGPEMPTINDEKRPERDLKNFPRMVRMVWPEKTRLFLIPDSWFQFFKPKTGETGGYAFFFTFTTFLVSKEYFVIEHEAVTGLSLAILTYFAIKKFGPKSRHFLCDIVDEESNRWNNWQKGMISFLNEMIDTENKLQESAKNQNILFDAKRENVKLQLEAEFRRRQMVAYNEVKNRLEYLMAKQVAQRQYTQKHMVNWIIDQVSKSITSQMEKEVLQKCLSDLKQLSTKHQIS